jgi:peroxiredoxin Q/BCP
MTKYDFKLKETDGKEISLEDYRGKNVIVYFYPKDNTPCLTVEAKGFRDLNQEFEEENTVILGISKDDLNSHKKFRDKFELNFHLLSDPDAEVQKSYDVWKPKKMFGKEFMGTERATFVFDKEGELKKEYRKVKADGHADEVLKFVKENL